jgi:hypothetical protein
MAKRQDEETREMTQFLEIEKKRADEDLERVQRQTSAFLAAHPEFLSAKAGVGTVATTAEAKKAAAQAASQRRVRDAANADRRASRKAAQVAPGAPPVAEGPAPVDPVLVAARTQALTELVAAKKDYNDKSSKYTEQHPDVRAASARLAAAQAALQKAQADFDAAQPPPAEPAPRRGAAAPTGDDDPYGDDKPKTPAPGASGPVVRAEPREQPIDLDQGASLEIEYERLQRQLTLAHSHDNALEQQLYHAEMVASTNESGYGTTIAVLDPAYRPSGPSNLPNKTVVLIGLAASVVVGLVLSAAWGLFLDDRVFSPNEIEGIVLVPVVGIVPRSAKPKKGAKKPASPGAPSAGEAPGGRARILGIFRRRAA